MLGSLPFLVDKRITFLATGIVLAAIVKSTRPSQYLTAPKPVANSAAAEGRGLFRFPILLEFLVEIAFGLAQLSLKPAGAGLQFAFGLEATIAGQAAGGFF